MSENHKLMMEKRQLYTNIKKLCPRRIKTFILYLYGFVLVWYSKINETIKRKNAPKYHREALSKLKNKSVLRCAFFVSELADWKCESVYRLMLDHPRFHPMILICPVVHLGEDMMASEMKRCEDYFSSNGYDFICAYDKQNNTYYDVKRLKADLIFYTTPYVGQSSPLYFILNNLDVLGIYIPYGIANNIELSYTYDLLFHNLLWRYYVETEDHMAYLKKTSRCHGRNGVITGFPAIENLIDHHKPSFSSWKSSNPELKRVIWAPHHTIEPEGSVSYSCFLTYAEFMIHIAEKYMDSVQLVFKPHPLLRQKLELMWGKAQTDSYYRKWAEMPNTSLAEDDYVDLFLTSDAMIHDSGSFLAEYLYVNKPVMRTLNDIPIEKLYNSFALKCLDHYYFAHDGEDIEVFIQNVINGIDPLKEQRTKFIDEVLMPKGLPSQNIISDILDSVDNQILYRN